MWGVTTYPPHHQFQRKIDLMLSQLMISEEIAKQNGFTKKKSVEVVETLWELIKKSIELGEFIGRNRLKAVRESLMISKTELAREANMSLSTLNRIENGHNCRLETKIKILKALGFDPQDDFWNIFPEDIETLS